MFLSDFTFLFLFAPGKLVKTYTKTITGGAMQLMMNSEKLAPGVCILEITNSNNGFVSHQKLIKPGNSGF